MKCVLEFEPADGTVHGTAVTPSGDAQPFSGWLELLRILETAVAGDAARAAGPAVAGAGDPEP